MESIVKSRKGLVLIVLLFLSQLVYAKWEYSPVSRTTNPSNTQVMAEEDKLYDFMKSHIGVIGDPRFLSNLFYEPIF